MEASHTVAGYTRQPFRGAATYQEAIERLTNGYTQDSTTKKPITTKNRSRLTRPCSRPLRARDHSYFGSFCGALAAADGQPVGRLISTHVAVYACSCYSHDTTLSTSNTE